MATAARNFVQALHVSGVPVTTECLPNLATSHNLGEAHKTCRTLLGRDISYKVKIIHTTPDIVTKYLEPMKYHIFHLFWEVDSLPKWWVWSLNLCDEIWTGSEWNKEVFIKSGVKKPIYVFPQPVDEPPEKLEEFSLVNRPDFIFYSIFQWIERKNPKSLLTAYWKEFTGQDDVGLLIKTYRETFSNEETAAILREIESWKKMLSLSHYPKVMLSTKQLDRTEIWKLHNTGDCLVSSHRGEGWGIPIAEALMMGKPVISTNLGGVHEFIPKNAFLGVKYEWMNVFNMNFVPWYEESQKWAQVDEEDLRRKMRAVYEKREAAKNMGLRGQVFAKESLSFMSVGSQLKNRIKQIYEENNF